MYVILVGVNSCGNKLTLMNSLNTANQSTDIFPSLLISRICLSVFLKSNDLFAMQVGPMVKYLIFN